MMEPALVRIEVVLTAEASCPGDDTVFVAARGGGDVGWYGPVSTEVGRAVEAIAAAAAGTPVTDHWGLVRRLCRAAGGDRRGWLEQWAVGAVDCAVWDLHGRLLGKPVAELMAQPRARTQVPAYASWLRADLTSSEMPDALVQVAEEGWAFTKWGLRRRPGPTIASEARDLVGAVQRAAQHLGTGFAVDAVGTWNPELSTAFAAQVDASALLWLEDPLPEHDLPVYGRLAATGLPLAVGEMLMPEEDLPRLLGEIRPAALTIDVVGCGGLTRAVEIVSAAREASTSLYPHGRSLVPGIHLAAAFPDVVPAVEYRRQWEPRRQQLYKGPWTPVHGAFPSPASAGLGTEPRRPQ
ncbi:enolase C-terminal domain-like protein [Actinacidiphila sp. ITFR-21]|uniref:enolase C-terminal domain-like protein n=1 Tax=Actinacidiphila sp. ITFR-21 TaxID=3075199 RepID=UPI00288A8949|nr:enolase C-terminal domain-like protein [Streptomyces sp. ITFR-21]WNI16330.1 enolase C-terminal domain-like protein [Streptomyces sp. ITFR-21]